MPSRCTTLADSFIRPGRAGPCTPAMALPGYDVRMAWTPHTAPAATGTRFAAATVADSQQCRG